jgi:hypothetical protein
MKKSARRLLICCSLAAARMADAQEAGPFQPSSPFDAPPAAVLSESADADLRAPLKIPSVASLLQWGPVNLRPHVNARFTYGDGLHSRPGASVKTVTESLTPGMLFELGRHWRLDYSPTMVFYSSKELNDRVSHSASLLGSVAYEAWQFSLAQTYSYSSVVLDETARQTTTEIFGTRLGANHYFNSKLMLELGVQQRFRLSSTANSTKAWSTLDWLNYQVAPAWSVGLGVGGGYDQVTIGPDMAHETLQGRVSTVITEKLSLNVHGGIEVREFLTGGASEMVNPIYGAGVQYRPFKVTTLSLSGNRQVGASLLANQVTESTSISLALNQRLLGAAYLTLSGGFQNTQFHAALGGLTLTREDDNVSFMASLSYSFLKRTSSSVFYQYRNHSSSQGAFAYDSNLIGLNLSYRY